MCRHGAAVARLWVIVAEILKQILVAVAVGACFYGRKKETKGNRKEKRKRVDTLFFVAACLRQIEAAPRGRIGNYVRRLIWFNKIFLIQ